jgi:hypothetical protein
MRKLIELIKLVISKIIKIIGKLKGHNKIYSIIHIMDDDIHNINERMNTLSNVFKKEINNEKRLRIDGDKDINKKIRMIHLNEQKTEEIANYFGETSKKLNIKIKEIDQYINKFKFIEELAANAEKKYNQFIKKLKTDISEFEVTHQLTRRMASIEERITMVELTLSASKEQLHGCSTETPKPIGTDKE